MRRNPNLLHAILQGMEVNPAGFLTEGEITYGAKQFLDTKNHVVELESVKFHLRLLIDANMVGLTGQHGSLYYMKSKAHDYLSMDHARCPDILTAMNLPSLR